MKKESYEMLIKITRIGNRAVLTPKPNRSNSSAISYMLYVVSKRIRITLTSSSRVLFVAFFGPVLWGNRSAATPLRTVCISRSR